MYHRKRIIVAEDNPADAALTKMAFEATRLPITLHHVVDGTALIHFLENENLEEVSLILLDLNMPKMGGIDVLKHLQKEEELKKIPVIIFSSSTHAEDVKTCYSLGANAYVRKPIDIKDHQKTISAIANFWTKVNVLPVFSV